MGNTKRKKKKLKKVNQITFEHNNFIDFLKGSLIILVILGHCVQFGSGEFLGAEYRYSEFLTFKIIYSFHMPLFIAVNGFLIYFSSNRYKEKELIQKKAFSYLTPLIIWNIFGYIIEYFVSGSTFNGFSSLLVDFISYAKSAFWFLWVIFMLLIIQVIYDKIPKLWQKTVFIFLFIALSFVLPDKYNLDFIKFLYPFYLTGFLTGKYKLYEKFFKLKIVYRIIIITIAAASFAFLIGYYNKDTTIYITGIKLTGIENTGRQFVINIYRWLIGYLGSFLYLCCSYLFYRIFIKIKCSFIIENIGKLSLGIYAMNYSLIHLQALITKDIEPTFLLWIAQLIIILIPLFIISWLLTKNKYTNMIFFGKRIN